jgi:hypothetical protein
MDNLNYRPAIVSKLALLRWPEMQKGAVDAAPFH